LYRAYRANWPRFFPPEKRRRKNEREIKAILFRCCTWHQRVVAVLLDGVATAALVSALPVHDATERRGLPPSQLSKSLLRHKPVATRRGGGEGGAFTREIGECRCLRDNRCSQLDSQHTVDNVDRQACRRAGRRVGECRTTPTTAAAEIPTIAPAPNRPLQQQHMTSSSRHVSILRQHVTPRRIIMSRHRSCR
jgi:hypothetical protein